MLLGTASSFHWIFQMVIKGWAKDEISVLQSTIDLLKYGVKNSFDLVREFHEKFGHPIADEPTTLDEGYELMRLELIREELVELYEACGYDASEIEKAKVVRVEGTDIVAVADALGDLEYVVNGMAVSSGIPLPAIVSEIHRSNMTKLGEDGKPIYREDGKVLKGPGYEEPQLQAVLGF